ncbi:uncharacterized protein B0I36DRAFT_355363 [Microdochium trichocladiopsis]|uniref:HTH APSES-type domain-containing protein n=1 Tax=Microdochium trichocladiopsis TaxID=1682393 RepID=A0A9P8XRJ2_9PEZI|nr:uncharacterized protein B0I36DRAFT_355363 [Microdochium trichocladiopsis]KAH7014093.1 hypothetical protein B0I36DRAFT_355363 [Microdochium trichocladiopsis]
MQRSLPGAADAASSSTSAGPSRQPGPHHPVSTSDSTASIPVFSAPRSTIPPIEYRNNALPSEDDVPNGLLLLSCDLRFDVETGPDGTEHQLDRIQVPVPGIENRLGIRVNPGSVDVVRYSSDGYISAYGIFLAAFPLAPHQYLSMEREHLRSLPGADFRGPDHAIFIPQEQALLLAAEYGISRYVAALAQQPSLPQTGVRRGPLSPYLPSSPAASSSSAPSSPLAAYSRRSEAS